MRNAELRGADEKEMEALLGRARAKKGMFEGNLEEGELEIGQVASYMDEILPAETIVNNIMSEFYSEGKALAQQWGF